MTFHHDASHIALTELDRQSEPDGPSADDYDLVPIAAQGLLEG